jgi:hypothetical protein
VKHPQEMDLSDLETGDESLLSWTQKKPNGIHCSTYYRRLVRYLFDKKRFQMDPGSDYYIANVPLRMKKEQFELIVEHEVDGLNLNEIDDLLADILKQSNDEDWAYPVAQILFEHYRRELIESLPSLNSPIVMIVIAILTIILISRFFHFSKLTFSAMILFVFLAICAVSYTMTYFDCLSDLEVEQMIQLSKQKSTNNPCNDFNQEDKNFWSSMRATLLGSSENKCLEHMRKTFKPSKKFCDPLDIFAKWFGKIQMSYFNTIFGGFFEMISTITTSKNFITKIIFWAGSCVVFVYILLHFGREIIIHGFKGIFGMLRNTRVGTEPNVDIQRLSTQMEMILQENQQMRREIRELSVERTLPSSLETPLRIEESRKLPDIVEESS